MNNEELIAAIMGSSSKATKGEKSALEFISQKNAGFSAALTEEAEKKREEEVKKKREEEKRKKEEADKKLRESLDTNQFLLTDVTGGILPTSKINHVLFRYPEGTWDEEHEVNIPEVNPHYKWDADVLEALWLAYILNEKALAVGPPGSGKTTAGQQLAAWIRQPYARFNGKDGIEPASFLGYPWASEGKMIWKDGLMPQAVANGYYTAIDEVFKLPPGIQMAMQSLYEKNGFLMLDEKPGTIKDKHIQPRKEFRLLGADNSKGTGDDLDKYGAGQMQDVSTLDRFTITIPVNYMKREDEVNMLTKQFPNVPVKDIQRSVAMANLVRESFKQGNISLTMSPRGLGVVCGLIEKGVSLKNALCLTFVNKLGDDSEVRTAQGFLNSAI